MDGWQNKSKFSFIKKNSPNYVGKNGVASKGNKYTDVQKHLTCIKFFLY